MKKFILNIFAFLFIIIIVSSVVLVAFGTVIVPVYSSSFNAGIKDKIERLKSLESPKIILVGNSNVAFGIDSELIEKETNVNVVNLGLHGGLGNGFHERMAMQNICKGDIVVILHTDYASHKAHQPETVWMTIENYFDLYPIVGKENLGSLIKALPEYIRTATFYRIFSSKTDSIYLRRYFNKYGDFAYPRSEVVYEFSEGSVKVPKVDDIDVSEINKLNDYCNEVGARLVIAGSPIADGEYTPPHEEFETFWSELTSKVNCPVISDIDDYFFDYSLFYDSQYHLNTKGAILRTENLVKDLKEHTEDSFD